MFLGLLLILACALIERSNAFVTPSMSSSPPGGTAAWPPADRLSEYVKESNLVDYRRLAAQENEWLAPVISSIKSNNPTETNAERHAFLINAYNLWTLHYVVRERRFPGFKGAVSMLAKARFFYWHKVSTGAGRWNLYNFENKVIRPDLNDARVHFALNCASMSCPPLRRKLFTGPGLDAELDEVTSAAINGGAMVQLKEDGKALSVNPIFKWYKEDFDKEGGVEVFIRSRWTGSPIQEDPRIEFFDYDWRSNSADATWSDRALGGPAP
ncbi:conserved unknown protein [Ectocarpus siliculosus]|uniref:DUF547 domain-containing protein n=1 Tax=Ectocarpus siliculosus TaxID=2880 RepID=D7FR47_ECTSI|nr:conserved unknown protein [Ectocarpus siliculosus]|eukprot:CBJ26114.1 conserved unknown protein [Ectocarpus siliculosus]